MAENSKIEWTTHTFNAWWGCVEVSPACDHCYARTLAQRFGLEWGKDGRRRFFGDKHWAEPLKWNKKAKELGVRARVFCGSMMDVMERLPKGHPDEEDMRDARARLFQLIEYTPNLDWLLLTKRPANFRVLLPRDWVNNGCPPNVWLMTTVEGPEYVSRIHELLRVPTSVYGLSMEPLFGMVDLPQEFLNLGKRGWVIAGGESGPHARPGHPDWYRHLRDQAVAAGVPFHFKQWGCLLPIQDGHMNYKNRSGFVNLDGSWEKQPYPGNVLLKPQACTVEFMDKHIAGRILDGRTWDELPSQEEAQ